MKIKTWIIASTMLLGLSARATDVLVDVNDFGANPSAGRTVTYQVLEPFPSNLFTNVTDDNGQFTISNAKVADYAMTIRAQGGSGSISFQFTVTATNLGTVNASAITSQLGIQTYPTAGKSSWTILTADQRYQLAGTVLSNTFYPLFSNPSNYVSQSVLNSSNYVDKTITNGLVPISLLNSASNSLQSQIVSGAVTLDQVTNVATNQVFLGTNGLVDARVTNGLAPVSFANTASNSLVGTAQTIVDTSSNLVYGKALLQINTTSNSVISSAQTAINSSSNSLVGTSQIIANTSSNLVYANGISAINISSNLLFGNAQGAINTASNLVYANSLAQINTTSNSLAGTSQSIANTSSNLVYGKAVVQINTTSNSVLASAQTAINTSSNSLVGTAQTIANTSSNLVLVNAQTAINTSSNSLAGTAQTIANTSSNSVLANAQTAINSSSNILNSLKVSATNGFSTNQIISHGYGTNGFYMQDGDIRAAIDVPSSSFKVSTVSSNFYIRLSIVNDNGGTGDIEGPQGQAFEFNTDGEVAMQDSGGERVVLSPVGGIIIEDDENHILMLDTNLGNFTLTGGGSFVGLGTGIIGKVDSTNGFAKNLTATNNTLLEGTIFLGPKGDDPVVYSSTNVIVALGAGTSLATNGVFCWMPSLNCYSNWVSGSIYTNNGSAWLLQNPVGTTLYSLSGSSPAGVSTAVGGSVPAPTMLVGAYLDGNRFAIFGPLSMTNIMAISNAIVQNVTNAVSSGYVKSQSGFSTNQYLDSPYETNWTNPEQHFFQYAANGQWNTNAGGAGFGAAVLSGTTNRIFNHGASVIAGGMYNKILGFTRNWGAILGGLSNSVDSGDATSIAGGTMNSTVLSYYDLIGGGQFNQMTSAQWASILGGYYNTNNTTGGAILGGQSNRLTGNWSLAFGTKITSTFDNTYSFSDSATTTRTNSQMWIQATNGVYINGPLWSGNANTNSGIYFTSNNVAPFSLWAVTNSMPNFSYWMGESNGVLVLIYMANGTPTMKALWP